MLTDEDKQWILERLGKVEKRLGKVETALLTESGNPESPAELRRRSRAAVLAVDTDFESFSDGLKKAEAR